MKNIYEDGTLPGASDIPEVKRQSTSPPTRPRKKVTPTPMQQEKQQAPQPQMPQPTYPMPPYGMPYPYVPAGTDQNGQPVYNLPPQQMQYPQVPLYPYAPYMSVQPIPQPQAVPEQAAAPTSEQNPGTRVLYQNPEFDMNENLSVNKQARAGFASGSFRQEPVISQEDIDIEEVTFNSPNVVYKPARVPVSENIEIDEVDFDYSDISTKADNTEAKPTNEASPENSGKKHKLPKSEIIRRAVLSVSIVAIIVAAGMLINEYRLAKQNEDVEKDASDLIITEPTTAEKDKDDKNDKDEPTTAPLTPEQQWAQIKQEYPSVIFPANIQLKYAKLYAENTDFVGYLSADGVNLNLPVVQTDNDEEYLKKNFYGASTKYGCPFVTHLNEIDPLDMNTVIFGHHMNNGTIFGALDAYKSINGFKKAPVITFNTLHKDYSWKIIAAFITNDKASDDNGYVFRYYFTNLSTHERFAAYLNELSQRSLYDTGVDVVSTDKILTLSTCSHEFEDARFVVVARLVRPGESASVDTSRAVVNSSPRYPQAYYDAKKIKTNPYKNASRWEVG